MSESLSSAEKANIYIDVEEAGDVHFWCEELNLRVEDLREIVVKVGPSIHAVRNHLARKLLLAWPVAY